MTGKEATSTLPRVAADARTTDASSTGVRLRGRVLDGVPLVLTVVSVTAALCAVALNLWAQSRGYAVWRLYYADVAVGLTFPPVGLLVLSRRPRDATGWILVVAGLLVGIQALTKQWAFYGGQAARRRPRDVALRLDVRRLLADADVAGAALPGRTTPLPEMAPGPGRHRRPADGRGARGRVPAG